MLKLVRIGFAIVVSLMAIPRPAMAAQYVIDPAKSELVVRLFRGGVAAAFAHNHVIRATDFSGGTSFDPEFPSATSMSVETRADSLQVDEPAVRQKYGLTEVVSDKDRKKIQATMESAEQLDVARFPKMKFQSTKVEKESDGKYIVSGELTIHGVKRSVSFPVTVSDKGEELRGQASLRFKQSDFGIKPFSIMLGAVRNEDEAILYMDVVATPRTNIDLAD
ncbi:YceI family protein [Candidatus Poribacteria bacterium]|nr:YceI family protein [Candidatus Poribacteria bacterium]